MSCHTSPTRKRGRAVIPSLARRASVPSQTERKTARQPFGARRWSGTASTAIGSLPLVRLRAGPGRVRTIVKRQASRNARQATGPAVGRSSAASRGRTGTNPIAQVASPAAQVVDAGSSAAKLISTWPGWPLNPQSHRPTRSRLSSTHDLSGRVQPDRSQYVRPVGLLTLRHRHSGSVWHLVLRISDQGSREFGR
jgi:hypothetical protein